MRRKIVIKVILFFLVSSPLFSFGDYPSRIEWRCIKTDAAEIIYPKGLKSKADRIANMISYIKETKPRFLGDNSFPKLKIILQSDQVVSNGYVAWLPYRSSFYTTAPQDIQSMGSTDWLDLLSIHEYRHTIQYANALKGISQIAYILMGEYGVAILSGGSIPDWFWEGDAVLSETLLSSSGRGRSPSFSKEQRALLFNGKEMYSYEKSRNGSFKDLVPSYYPLGYILCNYVRNSYGDSIWKRAFSDGVNYRGIFYPFSRSLKKNTGYSTKELYKLSYQDLKNRYQEHLSKQKITKTKKITQSPKSVVNYMFPNVMGEDIIVLKSSYEDTPKIVQVSRNGNEKMLTRLGVQTNPFISVNRGKVLWTEVTKNLRRNNENFHALVVYDIESEEKYYIKSKTKFFSPQYANLSEKIVVVELTNQMKNNIKIINLQDGHVVKNLKNDNNDFISYPIWTKDDKHIVYISKRGSKIAILKQRIETGQIQQLIPWTNHVIGNISLTDEELYFSASFDGIDNIYSVNLGGGGPIKRISSVKIGAYMPAIYDRETIVFSEFTDKGYRLSKIQIPKPSKKVDVIEPINMPIFRVNTDKVAHNILDKISDKSYIERKYSGVFKGFRPYGWKISALSNFQSSVDFGDIFQNWNMRIGYISNSSKYSNYYIDVDYLKLFPVLSLGFNRIDRNENNIGLAIPLSNPYNSGYSENLFNLGVSVPLSGYHGNMIQNVNFSSKFYYRNIVDGLPDLYSLENRIMFSHLSRLALQDIFPRWGVSFDAVYSKSLTSSVPVEKVDLTTSLYIPGLLFNDGIKLGGQYMNLIKKTEGYNFPNNYVAIRSVSSITSSFLIGFKKWTLDYAFPIVYPDFGGGAGIVYFNRLRANVFYDYVEPRYYYDSKEIKRLYKSAGLTLSLDGKLLNNKELPFSLHLTGVYYIENPLSNQDYEVAFGITSISDEVL